MLAPACCGRPIEPPQLDDQSEWWSVHLRCPVLEAPTFPRSMSQSSCWARRGTSSPGGPGGSVHPVGDPGRMDSTQPETAGLALHPSGVTAERLEPGSAGRWLVKTRGSRHVWDLDAGTWQRLPGPGRSRFPWDQTPVRISRVERLPAVGDVAVLWFDDPDAPTAVEHWRQSSTITAIERLADSADRPTGSGAAPA
jgi:hypothetical protein